MVKRIALVAAVLVAVLTPTAAHAMLLPDDSPGAARETWAQELLFQREAQRYVREVLLDYVGPAVADGRDAPEAAVWNCRAHGNMGTCRGRVTVGAVTCRGLFRIREVPAGGWVSPLRMVCGR